MHAPTSLTERDPEVLLAELRSEGVAPNLSAGIATFEGGRWNTRLYGEHERVFDLASVTKPMTAFAVALSGMDPRSPLEALLPLAARTFAGKTDIETLLAHRAGLQAHINLFLPLVTGQAFERASALRQAADARRIDADTEPYAPLYSDMGYALVGEALAHTSKLEDAGAAITRWVVPHCVSAAASAWLGVSRDFDPIACAPTEHVDWRGGLIQGIVHDENAFALTGGGGSGHAGMFGNVAGVLAFGRLALDTLKRRGPLAHVDAAWLVKPREGGTLRAGFDGKSREGSTAGTVLGPNTFGHLGFTGTSLWIDPDLECVTVFLSNRISPSRENQRIRAARPRMHDTLARLALRYSTV
jgi:serine-type D-Ala-D-Ala carboxypeptidase